jgi:flagellar basal-body rod protein FlgG
MNGAFEVGAVALRADQKALELLANNIANVNTPAYKRADARFAAILAHQVQSDGLITTAPADETVQGGGVRIRPAPYPWPYQQWPRADERERRPIPLSPTGRA